ARCTPGDGWLVSRAARDIEDPIPARSCAEARPRHQRVGASPARDVALHHPEPRHEPDPAGQRAAERAEGLAVAAREEDQAVLARAHRLAAEIQLESVRAAD